MEYNSPPFISIPTHSNPIDSLPTHFLKNHITVILPQNPRMLILLSHVCHKERPLSTSPILSFR